MLTHRQGHLFVEHVLIHAHLVAGWVAGVRARVPHALQHHLQEQGIDLLRNGVQSLRRV
jgi:hypothetical protein